MKHYAGLDVPLEEIAICVVDGTGRIVRETRAPSEPEALVTTLREMGLAFERIGSEACSLTAWLHDDLRAADLPASSSAHLPARPLRRACASSLAMISRFHRPGCGWSRGPGVPFGNAVHLSPAFVLHMQIGEPAEPRTR